MVAEGVKPTLTGPSSLPPTPGFLFSTPHPHSPPHQDHRGRVSHLVQRLIDVDEGGECEGLGWEGLGPRSLCSPLSSETFTPRLIWEPTDVVTDEEVPTRVFRRGARTGL